MKFKTELHCHTAGVSKCGKIPPEEIAERYIRAGYTTLVVTNHINSATFTRNDNHYTGGDDWQEKVDFFLSAVTRAKAAAGDRLHVLWGIEVCRAGTRSDFLVYGLGEDALRATPDICEGKDDEFFPRLREAGALVYQAHPFRNSVTVTKPTLLDGIEVYNGHPLQDSRNDIAAIWAKKFSLRGISGSDLHEPDFEPSGGILTDAPITTTEELMRVLRAEAYELIRPEQD